MKFWGSIVWFCVLVASSAASAQVDYSWASAQQQQREQAKWQTDEWYRYFRATWHLPEITDPITSTAAAVYRQLAAYSGMQFAVLPAQNFTIGMAHHGGVILIDLSTLERGQEHPEVLAWALGHEWGHEALGHASNFYRQPTGVWNFKASPSSNEDEADQYSARFLARNDYDDLDALQAYLEPLPADATHRSGRERWRNIKRAYDRVKEQLGQASVTTTVKVPPIMVGGFGCVVGVWVDDQFVGQLSNMQAPCELDIDQFPPGRYPCYMLSFVNGWNPAGIPFLIRVDRKQGSIRIADDRTYHLVGGAHGGIDWRAE